MQKNTFFHIGHKKYFRQINGLTMGSYDAQTTSNNVLLFHELDILNHQLLKNQIKLYSRFIDDGFCVAYGDTTLIKTICQTISLLFPRDIPIEFCVRKFRNNFLDLWICLDHNTFKSHKFSYHIFQKEFNTYSYIHRTSNHPRHIFHGIIKTENIRYKRKSSSYCLRLGYAS